MKCEICGKGPAEGVSVFRTNPKGVTGVWRCREHLETAIDPSVQQAVSVIEARGISIKNEVVLGVEKPQQCDYCGKIAELRPYGRNGASICFECGNKPENQEEMRRQFNARLDGNKPHGRDIPRT